DHVGWSISVDLALPEQLVSDRLERRHVLRVALRRALVHPRDDRLDLLVAERHVVLELLDADAPVDVPRRHLPRGYAVLDRARPWADLFEGPERHRRYRPGLMTAHTLGLKDGGDVLREGDFRCLFDRKRRTRQGDCPNEHEGPERPTTHAS